MSDEHNNKNNDYISPDSVDSDELVIVPLDEDEDDVSPYASDTALTEHDNTADKPGVRAFFENTFKPFWLKNNKKNLRIGIAVVCVIVFVLLAVGGARIFNLLQNINPDDGFDFRHADQTFEDDDDFAAMNDVSDASSLDDLLYQWATNGGEKLASKNVINVLLFGVDSSDGSASGARSDTAMLVSLNKKTRKITLVSFMRDSYTYMDINGEKRFYKLNGAFSWGGPATTIRTIEDNYKIEIDKYVCVDFASFPKIIDAVGGVTVDVQPYESAFIRRTTKRFKDFPSGDGVRLTGDEALVFSRIRHSDSDGDVSRTRRQRTVIMALIESARGATAGQINLALDFIFPNIRTNYSKSEILSLSSQALMYKWMDYEIVEILSPAPETSKSATIKGMFVWIVDYPLEAQKIQKALYGTTNIVLPEDRNSALGMLIPKPAYTSSYKPTTTAPFTDTPSETESTSVDETTTVPGTEDTTVFDTTLPVTDEADTTVPVTQN